MPELKVDFPFTVRFDKNGRIRVPAAHRLHLYKGEKPYSADNNLGYLLLEGFIVCSFGSLERVMVEDLKSSNVTFLKPDFTDLNKLLKEYSLDVFASDPEKIKKRKARLSGIYESISNDSLVSVYLGRSALIDERPFMDCLADSKKK